MTLSDLPTPDGAVRVDKWENNGAWCRHFTGTAFQTGAATVIIHGLQFDDGHCERWISVRDATELNAREAQELASALTLTAHELGTLS
jgi:hypothetical protein